VKYIRKILIFSHFSGHKRTLVVVHKSRSWRTAVELCSKLSSAKLYTDWYNTCLFAEINKKLSRCWNSATWEPLDALLPSKCKTPIFFLYPAHWQNVNW